MADMVVGLGKFGAVFHKRELKNGANLFFFERKGMPISLRVVFFAGSRFDFILGTAHFLEHMLLAGTEKFPSKNLIASCIQRVGGDFSASTSANSLRVNVEVPEASDISIGTEILDQVLNHSLFNESTIEKERGSILSEFQSKASNPKEHVYDVSRKITLQNTPLEESNLGNAESIKSISKKDLFNHKNLFLTSGRAVFVASGDIDISKLEQALESIDLPLSPRFKLNGPLPTAKDKKLEVENYPGVSELQVIFSCRTLPTDYKQYCAMSLLSNLLGEGRGSRLITTLRYKEGLVYSVFTQYIQSPDWGSLSIKLSCDKGNFEKVKQLIFQEFDKLQNEGISDDELLDFKNKISKGAVRHSQTSEAWVNLHETQALFYPDDFKTLSDYINTINSLTKEDIQKSINQYLKEENFFTAICGGYK